MSEELVIRFFTALEAGDIETLREIYAPDAVIWHNDDLLEQSVEDNLKVLAGLHRAVSGLRYDVIRRAPEPRSGRLTVVVDQPIVSDQDALPG